MVIRATDRVSSVIGRDESLIEVFVSLSPAFERLRNAGMRRVMSRLVTVAQAARMAGVDATELVSRLNAHLRGVAMPVSTSEEKVNTSETAARPAELASIPDDMVVHLDVRDELRAGREPFSMIIAARRQVQSGGALALRAIFEPVPLYAVMKRQGLDHWTEQLADDDWRVWFYAGDATPAPAAAPTARTGVEREDRDDVVVIDVREMEPPEPMACTLKALEQLPRGMTLVQLNVRVPQFLLPQLEQRGFEYEVREQEPGLVRVFIRHGN